jgi:hypothetical protein
MLLGTVMECRGVGGKDRVSFGTNMTTEDESSECDSVEQRDLKLLTAVEHFHARRLKDQRGTKEDKRAVLNVAGAGSSKKQKTPVKSCVQEAVKGLMLDRR